MRLAEILDEAERLEKLYAVAKQHRDSETACYLDVATGDFYATHGPRLVAALRAAKAFVITDEVRNAADALRLEMEDAYWPDPIEHFGVRDAAAKLLTILDAAFLDSVAPADDESDTNRLDCEAWAVRKKI